MATQTTEATTNADEPTITEGNDDYPPEVQDAEPELRSVELPTDIAFLAADYMDYIFSFDATPDVTNWDRNVGDHAGEKYNYHVNAYRQLISEGRGSGGTTDLQLSWIQAMDIVYALQIAQGINKYDESYPPRYSESAPLGHLDTERVEAVTETLSDFTDTYENK